MEQKISKTNRRIWIVINYMSVICILTIFYAGKNLEWPPYVLISGIVAIIVFVFSFIQVFIGTSLWKMVHASDEILDERQIKVVLSSLKYSYRTFTIVCLAIIYGFAVVQQGPIDVVLASCLLYFAHTLPAIIIGWLEKEV